MDDLTDVDDVRIIDGYESTTLEYLSRGAAGDTRAQIFATLYLAEQVKRITDFFEKQERERIRAIFAQSKLGPF